MVKRADGRLIESRLPSLAAASVQNVAAMIAEAHGQGG
jgi:hypothetical protein